MSDDRFKEQKGYLTFAQNSPTTNYLDLAYCQALSIKCSQKINSYAVIVDEETNATVTDEHRKVFDYVIVMSQDDAKDDTWKLKNEWQAWHLTPFKETMKIESDMLFPVSIDHWWPGLQITDVCMATNIRDVTGTVSKSRAYRKLFDENNLPDVYTGLMYFRYSRTSCEFYNLVRQVYDQWPMFRDEILVNCKDEEPTTDVVFAIAALLIGVENCTNPTLSYPTFAHMKGAINGWGANDDWTTKLYAQFDDTMKLTAGFTKQQYPFHYYQKSFVTHELIQKYEHTYRSIA